MIQNSSEMNVSRCVGASTYLAHLLTHNSCGDMFILSTEKIDLELMH